MGERIITFILGKLLDWLFNKASKEYDLWEKSNEDKDKLEGLKLAKGKKEKVDAARKLLIDS